MQSRCCKGIMYLVCSEHVCVCAVRQRNLPKSGRPATHGRRYRRKLLNVRSATTLWLLNGPGNGVTCASHSAAGACRLPVCIVARPAHTSLWLSTWISNAYI